MAEQEVGYPIEEVPDADTVYMRAHQNFFSGGTLTEGVFREQEGGMSVDWSKYSAPERTRARARKPEMNAVLEMSVEKIRAIDSLDVAHRPESNNQAHCEVPLPKGSEDLTEVRYKLKRIAKIVLALPATQS